MAGHPVHGAILRAGLHAANAILIVIVLVLRLVIEFPDQIDHEHEHDFGESSCDLGVAGYLSGPRTPVRLPICSPGPANADLISE
jgi:hypothetical protein